MAGQINVDIGFDWRAEPKKECIEFLKDTFDVEWECKCWGEHLEGKWILLFYFEQFVRFIIGRSELEAVFQFQKLRLDEQYAQTKRNMELKRMSEYYVLKEICGFLEEDH